MATLGAMGGLAPATHDAALVLDAAGFDAILLETVGVGLDEAGVAELRQRYAERALGRLDADVVEAAARRVAGRECDPYTIIEGWLRV